MIYSRPVIVNDKVDKDGLKQILLIVLDNAFKHSTGYIRVSAQRNNGSVEIRVKDFGQAIPLISWNGSLTGSIAATTPRSRALGWG